MRDSKPPTLRQPDLTHWGPLHTEITDNPTPKLARDILAFYDSTLVPELVCSPEGADRPDESWIVAPDRYVVTTHSASGGKNERGRPLIGCWILKKGGIYYPCIDVSKGAAGALPILRALAYKSFETVGEELWADTSNSLIQAWVNYATDTPEVGRPDNMPLPKFQGNRVEWRS